MLTFGLCLATHGMLQHGFGKGLAILSLGLGIWLVLRASTLFDHSHSTLALLEEGEEHSIPALPEDTAPLPLLGAAVLIAAFALTITGLTLVSVSTLLVGTLVLMHHGWRYHRWRFLILLALCSYGPLAIWLLSASWTSLGLVREVALATLFIVTYCFSLPFLGRIRRPGERESIRALLLTVFTLFTLILIGLSDGLHGLAVLLELMPVVLAGVCGGLAWASHGRRSYAKYFWLVGLASLLLVFTATLPLTLLAMVGLLIGAALLCLGMTHRSYTARLAGMGVLAMSHLIFGLGLVSLLLNGLILPLPTDQLALGLVFALTLPFLAIAYRSSPAEGDREARLRPLLSELLMLTSLAVLCLLVFLVLPVPGQTLLWALVGLAGTLGGRGFDFPLLRAAGIGVLALSLAKILLVDLPLLHS